MTDPLPSTGEMPRSPASVRFGACRRCEHAAGSHGSTLSRIKAPTLDGAHYACTKCPCPGFVP